MIAISKDSPILRWGRAKVVEVFGADLRSLAAFRIVLALLVLISLAYRASDLYAHYTDLGILPRTVLIEEVLNRWRFSLNLINGELWFQALLFGAAALGALGLLVGYRTRLMTVVVWVLLLSIQFRNPLVIGGGDILLRLLLFWAIFLPLGAYWSVDRALKATAPRLSMGFLSMGTVGLFMQIAFMYWFAAALKTGPEWRVDGTALYYTLSIDQIVTPIGAYLLNFPELLKVLTFATMRLEAIGPFLLFFPFFSGLVRTATVLAFMSFQLGIWLTMDVGFFPWISAFCMVCFLPSWFWEKAAKLRAMIVKRSKVARRLQHVATRSVNAYRLSLQARLSPMVVGWAKATAGRGTRRDATLRSTSATVAAESRMLRSSIVTNALALFFLLYIFCLNLMTVSALTVPTGYFPLGYFLGIDQSWRMFAPYPPKNDGWYIISGTLSGGQQVNVMGATRGDFSLHEVSWEKPLEVANTYKNNEWRKYLEKIPQARWANQRLYLSRYICREWNARHAGDEQLTTLQIIYMLEMTLPDYQPSTPEPVVLGEHDCSG